jgi:curved DNA-binding protein CbpA
MKRDLPDYYEVLQVSRRADPMIITRAFRLLAAFYHPDNRQTGNQEIFREVLEAHNMLSDPVRRASYDRAKFATSSDGASGLPPAVEAVSDRQPRDERHLRSVILEALYHVRRSRPYKPLMPALAIAELFGRSMEEIQFSLWYLRGKKWIEMPDGSDIAITVAGVDEVEAHGVEGERLASASAGMIPLPAPTHTLDDPARSDRRRHAESPDGDLIAAASESTEAE